VLETHARGARPLRRSMACGGRAVGGVVDEVLTRWSGSADGVGGQAGAAGGSRRALAMVSGAMAASLKCHCRGFVPCGTAVVSAVRAIVSKRIAVASSSAPRKLCAADVAPRA
jgi:hypothetical protein